MSNKEINLKNKLKQALESTFRVISDDIQKKNNLEKNKNSNKLNLTELENLDDRINFIKTRAIVDSAALKKKFSNIDILKKNSPSNSICNSLYSLTEKIRYEALGGQMLLGIEKNLRENYNQMINSKQKDKLKSKEDVPVLEAFELYLLERFHNIKLNPLCSKILSFWKKDFDLYINDHLSFFKKNLENQNTYNYKFSQILKEMDIFKSEDIDSSKEENENDSQDNSSDDNHNEPYIGIDYKLFKSKKVRIFFNTSESMKTLGLMMPIFNIGKKMHMNHNMDHSNHN